MKKIIVIITVLFSTLNVLNAQKLDLIPNPVKIKQKEKVFVIPASVQIAVDKQHQLPLRERVVDIRFLTEQIENQCIL
jgi:hexosaminidase